MEQTENKYLQYFGRVVDKMPLLLGNGEVPLSVSGFFQHRNAIVSEMGDIYAYTSDLIAYGDEKRHDEVKVILTVDNTGQITEKGRKALELINSGQTLISGAVNLNQEYDAMNFQGVISLSRKELEKYKLSKELTEEQVLAHPLWRVALRHPDAVPANFAYDSEFVKEAVRRTFSELRQRNNNAGMDVYIDRAQKVPIARAFFVYGLGNRSLLGGGYVLDVDYGRLVGVAPEAQGAKIGFIDAQVKQTEKHQEKLQSQITLEQKLSQSVQSALDSGKAFTYNGILYVPARKNSGLEIK